MYVLMYICIAILTQNCIALSTQTWSSRQPGKPSTSEAAGNHEGGSWQVHRRFALVYEADMITIAGEASIPHAADADVCRV